MFIQTERTPNPRTIKFLPGSPVSARPAEFGPGDAGKHPFLQEVFSLGGVDGVLLGSDFVSVTLADQARWQSPEFRAAVSDIVRNHLPAIASIAPPPAAEAVPPCDGPEGRIRDLLDTHVRPAVAADGGDIVFEGFADGVLTLTMKGACSGCPSSTATLRHGIQNLMRHFVPEVREVRAADAA